MLTDADIDRVVAVVTGWHPTTTKWGEEQMNMALREWPRFEYLNVEGALGAVRELCARRKEAGAPGYADVYGALTLKDGAIRGAELREQAARKASTEPAIHDDEPLMCDMSDEDFAGWFLNKSESGYSLDERRALLSAAEGRRGRLYASAAHAAVDMGRPGFLKGATT